MTLDLERKQQRLDRYTITGLGALSIGSFAGAAHQAVLDGLLTAGTRVQTTLSVISVAGLVLFWLGGDFVSSRIVLHRVNRWERSIRREPDGVRAGCRHGQLQLRPGSGAAGPRHR